MSFTNTYRIILSKQSTYNNMKMIKVTVVTRRVCRTWYISWILEKIQKLSTFLRGIVNHFKTENSFKIAYSKVWRNPLIRLHHIQSNYWKCEWTHFPQNDKMLTSTAQKRKTRLLCIKHVQNIEAHDIHSKRRKHMELYVYLTNDYCHIAVIDIQWLCKCFNVYAVFFFIRKKGSDYRKIAKQGRRSHVYRFSITIQNCNIYRRHRKKPNAIQQIDFIAHNVVQYMSLWYYMILCHVHFVVGGAADCFFDLFNGFLRISFFLTDFRF